MKQEFPRPRLSVQPTSFKSDGFNLLDACHLVPLVYARYPLKKMKPHLKAFPLGEASQYQMKNISKDHECN